MTTLTITDMKKSSFSKSNYKAQELLELLLKNLNYEISFDCFSDKENKDLLESSDWKYDKISQLIDNLWK